MNVGMPQYGMPSGASSGAPYFNGWSSYGGFGQPQQGYGMSSPFGGFGGGYGMPSPFGGFGGYGQPFQQMPMGGGKGGYSSPFGQFQPPNFAAKGGTNQPQTSPTTATQTNPVTANLPGPPPPQITAPQFSAGSVPGYGGTASGVQQPLLGGNPMQPPIPSQPTAPIPQAVPPQMMNPVSGPVQTLPQQMFNQTRFPGVNSVLPGRNMLIGGYR